MAAAMKDILFVFLCTSDSIACQKLVAESWVGDDFKVLSNVSGLLSNCLQTTGESGNCFKQIILLAC